MRSFRENAVIAAKRSMAFGNEFNQRLHKITRTGMLSILSKAAMIGFL
jgi:hypothetical protein